MVGVVGCLACCLIGCLVQCLVWLNGGFGSSFERLMGLWAGFLFGWLFVCLLDWWCGWLFGCLIEWQVRLYGCLAD